MCLLAVLVDCSGRALRLKRTESAWLCHVVCRQFVSLIERGQDSPALRSCAWPSQVDIVWRTLKVRCVCAVLVVVAGRASRSPLETGRDGSFAFAGPRTFQAEHFPSCG